MENRSTTVLVAICLLSPLPALAYLDPAGGSMFLQLLFAAVAGLVLFLKLAWRRIRALFGSGPAHEGSAQREKPAP